MSESGSGYTWSGNSRENQLTPWSNDPVGDPAGETIYVRDEETGELWGPTALPIREETAPYLVRHGQGYTRFEHDSHGVALELLQLVPLDDPVKISRLTLTNDSGRPRRLSVTAYVEWVLGASRGAAAPLIVTEVDPETGALLARNAWRQEFGARAAFADLGGLQTAWTATGRSSSDATAGRTSRRRSPPATALGPRGRRPRSLRSFAGALELPAGGRAETCSPGRGGEHRASQGADVVTGPAVAEIEGGVREHWYAVLAHPGEDPDRSMDIMLNRWLLYQTLACRVWARTAFYQAAAPTGSGISCRTCWRWRHHAALVREHLLRAAAGSSPRRRAALVHQPGGRGSGRGSRRPLWLPYVVARYVEVSGDGAVLEEIVPFLDGPPSPRSLESYFEPRVSGERGTSSSTVPRARSQPRTGAHGLR